MMGWWLGRSRSPEPPARPAAPAWSELAALAPTVAVPGPATLRGDFTRSLSGRRAMALAPLLAPPAPHPQVSRRAVVMAPGPSADADAGMVTRLVRALLTRAWSKAGRARSDIAFAGEGSDGQAHVAPPLPGAPGPSPATSRARARSGELGDHPAEVTDPGVAAAQPGLARDTHVDPGRGALEYEMPAAEAPAARVGTTATVPTYRRTATARSDDRTTPRPPSGPAAVETGTLRRSRPAPTRLGLGSPRAVRERQPSPVGSDRPASAAAPSGPTPVTHRTLTHDSAQAEPSHAGTERVGSHSREARPAGAQEAEPARHASTPMPTLVRPARALAPASTPAQQVSPAGHRTAAGSTAATARSSMSTVVARSSSGRGHHARVPGGEASSLAATALGPTEPTPVSKPPAATRPSGIGAQAVQRASAAVPPADQPEDLDEVMERLYERISSRLKLELLVDRERCGSLVDLW